MSEQSDRCACGRPVSEQDVCPDCTKAGALLGVPAARIREELGRAKAQFTPSRMRRFTVEDVFAREYRMVNTDWGPEPFEPVAVELEPDGKHGWPDLGEKLVAIPDLAEWLTERIETEAYNDERVIAYQSVLDLLEGSD